jgi:hypothetical protein
MDLGIAAFLSLVAGRRRRCLFAGAPRLLIAENFQLLETFMSVSRGYTRGLDEKRHLCPNRTNRDEKC